MSTQLLDAVKDKTTNVESSLESIAYETVGDIASKDLRKAEVFKKWGVDFYYATNHLPKRPFGC